MAWKTRAEDTQEGQKSKKDRNQPLGVGTVHCENWASLLGGGGVPLHRFVSSSEALSPALPLNTGVDSWRLTPLTLVESSTN